MPKPIVRVDNWFIFPGEPWRDRPMWWAERILWFFGRREVL